MKYDEFIGILNKQIFDSSKRKLLEKIAKEPYRFVGIFRPTKPKAKILQNLLHSHEIRFGDAFEIIFDRYFSELGYNNLPKKVIINGKRKALYQLFQSNNKTYFIEQKVRDDHDSSKIVGQNMNFEAKVSYLVHNYDNDNLYCYMYFIDPSIEKNKHYFLGEISKLETDYQLPIKLLYGKELWIELNHPEVWDEILDYLVRWRETIPEMPILNFDENAQKTFDEIKDVDVPIYRLIMSNKEVCETILPILFPKNAVLHLLRDHFQSKEKPKIYDTLVNLIDVYLSQFK